MTSATPFSQQQAIQIARDYLKANGYPDVQLNDLRITADHPIVDPEKDMSPMWYVMFAEKGNAASSGFYMLIEISQSTGTVNKAWIAPYTDSTFS
jgi:hypothetical protein